MIIDWYGHCLNQCVQKTEHLNRLLHLSTTGKGFCIIASLLFLVVSLLRAGEPIMTLAMNQPSENNAAGAFLDSRPAMDSSSLNLKTSEPEVVSANEAMSVSAEIGKSTDSDQRKTLPLVREGSRSNKSVSVQAGYGRIWDDKSTLRKIAFDHQEPGCAYVSANFSF